MEFNIFTKYCQYHVQGAHVGAGDYCEREEMECSEQDCPLFDLAKNKTLRDVFGDEDEKR